MATYQDLEEAKKEAQQVLSQQLPEARFGSGVDVRKQREAILSQQATARENLQKINDIQRQRDEQNRFIQQQQDYQRGYEYGQSGKFIQTKEGSAEEAGFTAGIAQLRSEFGNQYAAKKARAEARAELAKYEKDNNVKVIFDKKGNIIGVEGGTPGREQSISIQNYNKSKSQPLQPLIQQAQERKEISDYKLYQLSVTNPEAYQQAVRQNELRQAEKKRTSMAQPLVGKKLAQTEVVQDIVAAGTIVGKGLVSFAKGGAKIIAGEQLAEFNKPNPKYIPPKIIPKVNYGDRDVQSFGVGAGFVAAQFVPIVNIVADSYLLGKGVTSGIKAANTPDRLERIETTGESIATLSGLYGTRLTELAVRPTNPFTAVKVSFETFDKTLGKAARRDRATLIVEDSTGRVLLEIGKKTGQKLLPGGVPNKGEAGIDAAIREAREETGLQIDKSKVQSLGTYSPLVNENALVFRIKLEKPFEELGLKPKSDVSSLIYQNPRSIRYEEPTQFTPYGTFDLLGDIVRQRTTRSDTAFIVDKFVNERPIDFYYLPSSVPRKALRGNIDIFTRDGLPIAIVRVAKPSLRKPNSILDFILGRKPGQFKYSITKDINLQGGLLGDIVKQDLILFSNPSRYNIKEKAIAEYVGKEESLISSASPNLPSSKLFTLDSSDLNTFEVQTSKSVRGEKGLFASPSVTPRGFYYVATGYLDLVRNLGAKLEISFRQPRRAILLGKEKAPKVQRRTTEPGELTFTRKGASGYEQEFILRPGTKIKYLGGELLPTGLGQIIKPGRFSTSLYGKRVGITFVQIVKDINGKRITVGSKAVLDYTQKNIAYLNLYQILGTSKERRTSSENARNILDIPLRNVVREQEKSRRSTLELPRLPSERSRPSIERPRSAPESLRLYTELARLPSEPIRLPPERARPPRLPPRPPRFTETPRRELDKLYGKELKKSEQLIVQERRRGKFKSVGRASSLKQALSIGEEAVKSDLGATFRVLGATGNDKGLVDFNLFRRPKKITPYTYVQRKGGREGGKGRLASYGERTEIALSRRIRK